MKELEKEEEIIFEEGFEIRQFPFQRKMWGDGMILLHPCTPTEEDQERGRWFHTLRKALPRKGVKVTSLLRSRALG